MFHWATSLLSANLIIAVGASLTSMVFPFVGDSARVRATGRFSNGTSADITSLPSTTFSSQGSAVATIDAIRGGHARIHGLKRIEGKPQGMLLTIVNTV